MRRKGEPIGARVVMLLASRPDTGLEASLASSYGCQVLVVCSASITRAHLTYLPQLAQLSNPVRAGIPPREPSPGPVNEKGLAKVLAKPDQKWCQLKTRTARVSTYHVQMQVASCREELKQHLLLQGLQCSLQAI
jgi:hypothetical protein